MMKQMLMASAILFTGFGVQAQALKTPAPSSTQVLKQDFGLGNIELSYSRPSVKGRKIFGDVVPFGKVWRTGANQATTLTFSDEVSIGGVAIKPGKYGMITIPGATEWTFIITKDLNVTSPSAYKQENDVVRVKAPSYPMPMNVETFTLSFDDVTNTSISLAMIWEKTYVSFPITTDVDKKVMAQIEQAMKADTRPYFNAAAYYYDNNKDLAQAKIWVDKAIESNPDAYWMTLLKARIHNKMGDKAGAKAMAQKTVELATKGKNDDYIKMASELLSSL
ncbi:MAG: DUF2911 domain-containing protein [Bacteroidetes bacterium]|nr:MAG: DUF2911 domain-containing protein [Bacteroidota bacterium]